MYLVENTLRMAPDTPLYPMQYVFLENTYVYVYIDETKNYLWPIICQDPRHPSTQVSLKQTFICLSEKKLHLRAALC